MSYDKVAADDADLLTFDQELQKIILRNGFVSQTAVHNLAVAGCNTLGMFYMLGSADDPALSQRNIGRSLMIPFSIFVSPLLKDEFLEFSFSSHSSLPIFFLQHLLLPLSMWIVFSQYALCLIDTAVI